MANNKKIIYSELSDNTLKSLQKVMDDSLTNENAAIIIKLGATWCGPCQKIAQHVHNEFNKLPESFMCFDIDIDDNLELYMALKKTKMVPSIPTILVYTKINNREQNHWYAPQFSYIGSDQNQITNLFNQIKMTYVK